MSITDYVNRKYDFVALQNDDTTRKNQLDLTLVADTSGGAVVVGVQKLTQRWLLEFLTELGSMPGLPGRGTDFMTLVRLGRLRSQVAVTTAFNFAAYTVRANLNKEEDDTWPPDERLADAQLLSVAFLPGYASLSVQIYSRAGLSRKVILPINTIPQTIM